MPARAIDLTGRQFGSVTAIRPIGRSPGRGFRWEFRCACGQEFPADANEVKRGKVARCPPCAKEVKRKSRTTHGLIQHALYPVWRAMKTRCENPASRAYSDYGGRGITVCERWRTSFQAFLSDMGERPSPSHTLERKNNDGGYEPGNVVWATRKEQANNKRNNHLICIDGVTQTLAEWALASGLTESGIRRRIRRGISGKDLLAPSSLSKHTFDGRTMTLAEWSATTSIKLRTLNSRLYVYGWDLQRALTTRVAR